MFENLEQIHPTNDSIEGKTIKFRTEFDETDTNNRESDLHITRENELVGRGAFSSWVKSVQARIVSGEGKESSEHTYVIKKYQLNVDGGEVLHPKHDIKKALLNFQKIKKAGVKTWNTYRVSGDNTMIIMTDANVEGKILVTKNVNLSEEAKKLEKKKLNQIRNFDSFLESLYLDIVKLSKNRINIEEDTLGIIFDSEGSENGISNIDFIMADLDLVKGEEDFYSSTESVFLRSNIYVMRILLPKILRKFVEESAVKEYVEEVQTFCDQKMSKLI